MVNFLIHLDKLSSYDKKAIDQGNVPPDVYNLCSCIRETFCISYYIRKSNNLYIIIEERHIIVKFEGINLRYLGPDERSQAILFLKAIEKEPNVPKDAWIKSTPGIFIKKFNQNHLYEKELDKLGIRKILLLQGDQHFHKLINIDEFFINQDDLFIIDKSIERKFNIELLNNVEIIALNNISSLEDKILYINYQLDQQELLLKG